MAAVERKQMLQHDLDSVRRRVAALRDEKSEVPHAHTS